MNKKKILSVFVAFLLLTFICSSSLNTKVFANGKKPNISYSEKKSNPLPEDMPNMFVGYMKKMQDTIKANWEPPHQKTSKTVVITYSIMKDGKLGSYKITQSSNNKKLDKAAVKALKKSAPFDPLPENFSGDHVDVQFTFDYNVFKNGKKQKP